MPILPAASLRETALFKRLQVLETENHCPRGLPGNVEQICWDAAQRLKLFPAAHPQFTLHDETHSLRVVQLMATVASNVMERLNAIELGLLVLAAFHHDQGMIVEAPEEETLRASSEWQEHADNWAAEFPNLREVVERGEDLGLTSAERDRAVEAASDLRSAMWTDFIRRAHGARSARLVTERYRDDPRFTVHGRSVAGLLASICESHVRSPEAITPSNGCALDELVGTERVNVALLAYILRLADILDFDRDRTPPSLCRAIHFTSAISLAEWAKHRSIVGWEVGPKQIRFSAECEHPAYERAIREYMNMIDGELSALHDWNRSLPADFQGHALDLPARVDRSRIRAAADPATGAPLYRYADLEFSLSRDDIVKLLMTSRLYSDRGLFVRELLQNALDALRFRKSIYQADGIALSSLQVDFEHFQESGVDVVRCTDNGSGMDEDIVSRFLTRVGRSYYRSLEFDRERRRFKERGCDFDPCARFGIGFMSCFMFGDDITIRTRRDHGTGREYGPPLVVEIRGLSGIVAIRPGAKEQPVGTVVEVRGRRRSVVTDYWSDPVRLVEILEAYALAVEFPVSARCRIPQREKSVMIQPGFMVRPSALEESSVASKRLFTASFAEADRRLQGEVRVCTLVDAAGLPTLANADARLEATGTSPRLVIKTRGGASIGTGYSSLSECRQLCCDGILVAGRPGRVAREVRLANWALNHGFGGATFLLDARGDIKPELTPARTPPDDAIVGDEPTWRRLFDLAAPAYSRLLLEVLAECQRSGDPERFWQVTEAYDLDLSRLPLSVAFSEIEFPFALEGASGALWRSLKDVGPLTAALPEDDKDAPELAAQGGLIVATPPPVDAISAARNEGLLLRWLLYRIIAACSACAATPSGHLQFMPKPPETARGTLADTQVRFRHEARSLFRCEGDLRGVVSVCGRGGFANADHPVTQRYRTMADTRRSEYSPLDRMLSRVVWGAVGGAFDADPVSGWDRRMRYELGFLYKAVAWTSVDPRFRPPFRVFRPGLGIDALTAGHLESWGAMPPPADDEA